MDAAALARARGGIVSRRAVLSAGGSDGDIRSALRRGRLRRLRAGWYSSGGPAEVEKAVRVGGVLSCISALRLQGAWAMPHDEVHIRVARGVDLAREPATRIHWSDRRADGAFPMDGPADAIRLLVSCADRRASVVALDSVVQRKMATARDVHEILSESARGRSLIGLLDGASESGIETLARLALRRLRVRVRTQVPIAGAGRVDLLIGDRLVLEVDGERWHTREGDFEDDRERDRRLVAAGYLVMRASYRQVMYGWPDVEQHVLAVVQRDAHRWPSMRR